MKRIGYASIEHNFKMSHNEDMTDIIFTFNYLLTNFEIPISRESMDMIFNSIVFELIGDYE